MKRQYTVLFSDDGTPTQVKVEQVHGIRRTPISEYALTDKESARMKQNLEAMLYALNANRSALSEEEMAALPQPEQKAAKKDKMEVAE